MGTVSGDALLTLTKSHLRTKETEHLKPRTPINFYITGFAKFHQVAINPTELLMNALPDYLKTRATSSPTRLVSTQTLKVAAETSSVELDRLYQCIRKSRKTSAKGPNVVLHFGVNVSVTHFALELQARNEATFLCPDELGWTPIMHKIEQSERALHSVRQTTLPIELLRDQLRTQGFLVDISTDAGRFVCNWVYYHSLLRARDSADTVVLFVHVPPESVVSIGEQLRFTSALMDAISQLHQI